MEHRLFCATFKPGLVRALLVLALLLICIPAAHGETDDGDRRHWNSQGGHDNWRHYERGLKQIEAKDWRQAEKEFNYYFENAGIHRHMFGLAFYGRGLMFQAKGNLEQAIAEYDNAIAEDIHPDIKISDKACMNIASTYFKKNNFKKAIEYYQKALKFNPTSGLAHYFLGMSYLKVGDLEKARAEGETAKKIGITYTGLDEGLKAKKENPKAPEKQGAEQVKR